MNYTDQRKLACLMRELRMREAIYPGRVRLKQMEDWEAREEIAVLREIAEDYKARVDAAIGQGQLF